MEEKEFLKKMENGEIEEIKEEEKPPVPTEEEPELKLEDYQKFLEMLRQFKAHVSTVPTDKPKSFLEQIVFYVSGSSYRLYFYIKDSWVCFFGSVIIPLTVVLFQAGTATGFNISFPERINDGSVALDIGADNIDEYVEVNLGAVYGFRQWRYHGFDAQNLDGEWKIQYWDLGLQIWVDWKTGIPTREATWTSWETVSYVVSSKIRFIGTTIDSIGSNKAAELEIKD